MKGDKRDGGGEGGGPVDEANAEGEEGGWSGGEGRGGLEEGVCVGEGGGEGGGVGSGGEEAEAALGACQVLDLMLGPGRWVIGCDGGREGMVGRSVTDKVGGGKRDGYLLVRLRRPSLRGR